MQAPNPGQGSTGGNNRSSGLSWSSPSTPSSPSSFNNTKQPTLLSSATSSSKPAATPVSAAARPTVTTSSTRMPATRERSGGRSIGIFIAGVVVGLLISWGWGATQTQPTNTANNTTPTNTSNTGANNTIGQITSPVIGGAVAAGATQTWGKSGTTPASNIRVQNQQAGMTVRVTDATVAQPTWLVVYELQDGKPVRALGATMFFPEHNGKGGVVGLLRATQPNTTYFVGQSLDTGNHTYTPHVNQEILDSNGNMVGVLFTTQ